MLAGGNNKPIFNVRIDISGGSLQAKLEIFYGFDLLDPLVRTKVLRKSIFHVKTEFKVPRIILV